MDDLVVFEGSLEEVNKYKNALSEEEMTEQLLADHDELLGVYNNDLLMIDDRIDFEDEKKREQEAAHEEILNQQAELLRRFTEEQRQAREEKQREMSEDE